MDFSRIKYKRSESSEDVVITIWRKNIYQKDYVAQNVIVDVAQNVAQSSIIGTALTRRRNSRILMWLVVSRESYGEGLRLFC